MSLTALLFVAACAPAGDTGGGGTAAPATPAENGAVAADSPASADDGLVVLSAFNNNTGFVAQHWGTDIVSNEIIARTGVTIDWEVNADDSDTRLNLIVASGDFPDIMSMGINLLATRTMLDDELVYSWEELFNRYAPHVMSSAFMARNERYLRNIYDFTDTIYTIPQGFADRQKIDDGTFLMQAPGYYVRQSLLDAVGNPPLNTLNDLENVLHLITEYDPTIPHPLFLWNPVGNGWDANGILVIYRSMGGRGDFYIQPDGSLHNIVRDPLFRETLLLLNRWYNYGFISHQNFMDGTIEQEAINLEGTYAVAVGHIWRAISSRDALGDVWPIPHLAQPGVDFYSPFAGLTGWGGFFIPRSNSNTEATAHLLEFLISDEGQALVHAGIEGEHFQWGGPDGTWIEPIGEGRRLMDEGWSPWSEALGTYRYLFTMHAAIDSAFAWGLAIGDDFLIQLYSLNSTGRDASAFEGIQPDPESLDGANQVRMWELFNPFVARIIMAGTQDEANALFDEMVADMEASGMAGVEAAWTANFRARNP
jgi:putative aldouronate transport system substrate-binding protein